jgi:tol-pal system beta propeller repeat protein TolB
MLSHRSLCIGLLLLPAFPAFGQKPVASHRVLRNSQARSQQLSAPVAVPQVRAVVLPVDGLESDSVQTIMSRDLNFGDRVQVVSDLSPTLAPPAIQSTSKAQQQPPVVVKTVATATGVTVSLVDPLSGAVRQQHDFVLPQVSHRTDQAIADSLNQAFDARDLMRRARIVRAEGVRDSLQFEMARKPPRLRDKQAKEQYAELVVQRNNMLIGALGELALVRGERERDEAARAGVQRDAIAREAAIRDSATAARRWAIHGVSDAVEEWLTGHRGIAQSRVAYVSNGVIRVVDFDGANDHPVTRIDKDGDKAMSPAWRRDGTAIVYSEMSDAGTQIAMVDLLTGKTHALAATPRGLNITPIFSTDDKSVIYANGSDFHTSLVSVQLDAATAAKPLPLNRSFDADEPILSPDGTRIAYVSSRPKTPQIYSSNLDGTDERVEAPAPPKTRVYHTSPDWSPDGRMIAYQQQNGDFQVWLVNRDSHSVRRLTSVGENEDPSWAPDARHIALTSNRGGAKAIWVLDIQTGRVRQLTAAGDARLAAWSGPLGSRAPSPLAVAR